MKHILSSLSVSLLVAGAALAGPEIKIVESDQFSWEKTPEGVAFAALDGARFDTAYMAMVRLPAGTVSPPHVKSASMYGLMVKGTMTHVVHGENAAHAAAIGPGVFYKIPAGLAHVSSCISDTPCETFLYQDGAFDFIPVDQ
ncbi:MAG: hypothetical protein ABJI96_22900 [Paracoccaceae bacterium]